MSASQQVDGFIQHTEAATADLPKPSPSEPKVPFQTNLVLTGDQEAKMLDWAFAQLERLDSDSGRKATIQPNWWANIGAAPPPGSFAGQGLWAPDTFMGKRCRFEAQFMNDVSWRPSVMGGIFATSNLSVPLSRRICRQMIARAQNQFFGSEPWFAVDPAPEPSSDIDEALATRINNFCRFKVKQSGSVADKKRAIKQALVLGECVVKTSYVVRDQMFNTEAMVLQNIEGENLVGQDQNVITQDDATEEDPVTGEHVLKRDGITTLPTAPIYVKQPLNRRQVLFEGAKSEPIYYKDFLCSMTATDLQTADCCIHLYDKPVAWFVDLIVKRGMVRDTPEERLAAVQKMSALVQQLNSNTPNPKAAATQEARPNEAFSFGSIPQTGPVAEFAEFYIWFDANNDGIAENIMLIADRVTKMPIFYDHVANVTTDGLRPLEAVRINPVENRWYGQGVMELFESYQVVVDLMVNRWNFSQSRSGRIDFWDPTATLEGEREPNLKLNWGGTYTMKPGRKIEEVLQSVYLNDTKFEALQTMTQFFTQLAMNESGVANANDNYVAGMEQAKLATGIKEIEKSGDELFRPIVTDLIDPLERVITREVDVILANINGMEAFTFLQGNTMGIDRITPEDVRGLKFKIRIELTQTKNQQTLDAAKACAEIVEKFYSLPPNIQIHVASLYKKQLRALDSHLNADEIIIAGVAMIPPSGGMPGEGGGAIPFDPGAGGGDDSGGEESYQSQAPQPAALGA
jgi:hypothetical protein